MRAFSRRAFLTALAGVLPVALLAREAHGAAMAELAADDLTLRALADAVLPTELGAARTAIVVADFKRWIASYRPGAELTHDYGTSIIRRAGATPATRWTSQLAALDRASRRAHGRSFARATADERRALVQQALDAVKADALPAIADAPHVALALLAHFYASPLATDLCYQAAIMKQACRPLSASPRRPLPLAPVGDG